MDTINGRTIDKNNDRPYYTFIMRRINPRGGKKKKKCVFAKAPGSVLISRHVASKAVFFFFFGPDYEDSVEIIFISIAHKHNTIKAIIIRTSISRAEDLCSRQKYYILLYRT